MTSLFCWIGSTSDNSSPSTRLYLGPSTRGRARGGGPRGGGYSPPARLLCPSIRLYLGPRGGVLEGGVRGGVYSPPARLLCPSTRLYLVPSTRGRARGRTAAVSKHQTISGTQHEGACSRGGVRGGGYPGCCVQASDYIWDPARGGVLEGGVRGGVDPPPGTAAVLNSH